MAKHTAAPPQVTPKPTIIITIAPPVIFLLLDVTKALGSGQLLIVLQEKYAQTLLSLKCYSFHALRCLWLRRHDGYLLSEVGSCSPTNHSS
jgi:hypothetical protein